MEGQGQRERERDGETHSQYYLAVDRQHFKLGTLVDLLDVIGRRSGLPIVLCCSSRDGLDSVCATISSLPYISLSCLHSDLSEVERASCIDNFRQIALEWMLKHVVEPEGYEDDLKRKISYVLVMTDSCLPMQALGEAPISGQILINYDLPTKKEAYLRRLAAFMAGIHFPTSNKVIGGTIPVITASTSTINSSHDNIVMSPFGTSKMQQGFHELPLDSLENGLELSAWTETTRTINPPSMSFYIYYLLLPLVGHDGNGD